MIQGLFETHIPVADFDRSRRFYEGQLGFEVGWIDERRRSVLYWVGARGNAMLGVQEARADAVSWRHVAFVVSLADMEARRRLPQRQGHPMPQPARRRNAAGVRLDAGRRRVLRGPGRPPARVPRDAAGPAASGDRAGDVG